MKKCVTLLIAIGLVSPQVFAQVQTLPRPEPGADSPGAPAMIDGVPENSSDLTSGDSNGMRSEAVPDLQPPPSPIARLKPVTQDDVTYLCGGVGEEESSYMKQEARDYDLMLTFATRSGAYLADVDVDIQDAKGNSVLQLACDSPILLVDLPRGGTYRIRAETAGYALNQTVRVAAGRKQGPRVAAAVLSWPRQVAETGGAPTATGSSGDGGSTGSGAR